MERTLTDRLEQTEEGRRLLQQEQTILKVTELICHLLDRMDVSRTELAARLGRTKGYVTQLLDGQNMTLRTISDVFQALGCELEFDYIRSCNQRIGPRGQEFVLTSQTWDHITTHYRFPESEFDDSEISEDVQALAG